MNIRKEIIMALNKPRTTEDLYTELKSCLILSDNFQQDIDDIDEWFFGIIKSLFYRPSDKCLALVAEQNIGKTEFFRRLLPSSKWVADYSFYPDLDLEYHSLVSVVENFKDINNILKSDGFTVKHDMLRGVVVNKRLTSVAYTTNSIMPERKQIIRLILKDIDKHKYNAIPKDLLWIEIYHRFLELHGISNCFTQEDIDNYFK